MEDLLLYLIKASGLIGLFYFAYILLLRKETFFSGNRWFLILGLISSGVLPLFFITKIIWVEPTPNNFDWSNIAVTTSVSNPETEINWYLIGAYAYFTGILISFIKLTFDFYSLIKVLKGKTMQQEGNFKFIDIAENIAPFSYFNYIVYNSALYSTNELKNILEHEKIHSQQKHSLDVLLSRLFCAFFWFNPLIWLYKKAIAQNLEFIADSEAAKKIIDKKSYQFTLLKITTQQNCVALTNHFYQSLIKKRIIMLNQNESKKWHSWKYAIVFPALIAFVFLFQIKIVAQEKKTPKVQKTQKLEILKSFNVTKETTDETINSEVKNFKDRFKADVIFSKIKRNAKGEIIAIKIDINCPNQETTSYQSLYYKTINPVIVFIARKKDNKQIVGFSVPNKYMNKNTRLYDSSGLYEMPPPPPPMVKKSPNIAPPPPPKTPKPLKFSNANIYIDGVKSTNDELGKLDNNNIDKVNVNKLENTVRITTKTVAISNNKSEVQSVLIQDKINKTVLVLNGKINNEVKIEDIDPNTINQVSVFKGQQALEKYGEIGKNGVIEITTKEKADKNEFKAVQEKQ